MLTSLRAPSRVNSSPAPSSLRSSVAESDSNRNHFPHIRSLVVEFKIFLCAFAAHEPFAAKCAESDLNREDFAFARPLGRKSGLLFAHSVRSCAGPDLNRRTPTGQRPKRCAFGLARQPALVASYTRPANECIAPDSNRRTARCTSISDRISTLASTGRPIPTVTFHDGSNPRTETKFDVERKRRIVERPTVHPAVGLMAPELSLVAAAVTPASFALLTMQVGTFSPFRRAHT